MSAPDTDLNLLYGVLALQAALIDNDQFADVCAAWTTRKQTPLPDILHERGWLTEEDHREVERLVERHLKDGIFQQAKYREALTKSPAFSVLRARDDFKQLLKEVEPKK